MTAVGTPSQEASPARLRPVAALGYDRLAAAFPHLPESLLAELAQGVEEMRFMPGETIVREGDPADRFYIIVSGQVEGTQSAHRDMHVLTMHAGEYFGEVGLLAPRTRTATVRAVGEVRVVSLDRAQFQALVDASEATGAERTRVPQPLSPYERSQMTNTKGRQMRQTSRRRGGLAILSAFVMAAALLTAGPASAASRGFVVHNQSTHALHLEAVKRVPRITCVKPDLCVPNHYPMDFEGRPADGSVLHPSDTQRFELKYGFSLLGGVQYAANLWYKIGTTGHNVEYTIEVYSTVNESACKVHPATAGRCTAEGTKLTFHNG